MVSPLIDGAVQVQIDHFAQITKDVILDKSSVILHLVCITPWEQPEQIILWQLELQWTFIIIFSSLHFVTILGKNNSSKGSNCTKGLKAKQKETLSMNFYISFFFCHLFGVCSGQIFLMSFTV